MDRLLDRLHHFQIPYASLISIVKVDGSSYQVSKWWPMKQHTRGVDLFTD